MQLKRLSLTHFRNFARLDVQVPPQSVLIVGRNAQGKTSLLEAIYFLATLNSFHADTDRQLINFIEARNPLAVARLQATYERNGREHQLEIRVIKDQTRNGERSRKEVLLDGAKKKANEVIGQFQAVLFLPQMLQIVDGSPRHRRRYLDLALAQVQSQYGENLSEFESVLTQRNALLRQLSENGGDQSQLDFWDQRLATRGAQVLAARFRAIQELEQAAARLHHGLTRGAEVLRLSYQPSYDPLPAPAGQRTLLDAPTDRSGVSAEKLESGYLAALQKARREDLARGTTSLGPHRDELRFLGNGVDLGSYGSRGQVRTALLTLKLAELEWMHARSGQRPVLLLDEVLAELDESRRADLLERLKANSDQVLLTTTDFNLFTPEFLESAARWEIDGGQLTNGIEDARGLFSGIDTDIDREPDRF
ncbi:MAG: DNA replication/repair protein RecF [Anaerolineales bacterium]|nr:MAG: DNA replication/repair protein RecF [Anaerolineales bacterium]